MAINGSYPSINRIRTGYDFSLFFTQGERGRNPEDVEQWGEQDKGEDLKNGI
jgi:hypothetical protein